MRHTARCIVKVCVSRIDGYAIFDGLDYYSFAFRVDANAFNAAEQQRMVRNHQVAATACSFIYDGFGYIETQQRRLGFSIGVAYLKPGVVVALLKR